MKNQQNKNMGTKKLPLFTYFCLLLAVATMCTGATFARYVTSSNGGAKAGVVPLVCSFSVDEISATSFDNSDYWMTVSGVTFERNTPREIIFSLHNYEKNGETKTLASEIDLQSTFRFFAPKELLGNVAFQILKKGAGNTRIPLTQQYVMPKIIQSVTGGQTSLSTEAFNTNYGEYSGRPEETLTLTNLGFNEAAGSGKLVAVAQTENEGVPTIVATLALSAEKRENISYEITQSRGKQYTIEDKTGNNMSAPEYYGVYQDAGMVYYCLDITLPSMTMVAEKSADGTFKYIDDQYVLAFTIIEQLTLQPSETAKKTGEHFNVKGVSLYTDSACTALAKEAVIKVVNTLEGDVITASKYYFVEGNTETEATLDTTAKTFKIGGTTYYVNNDTAANLNDYTWNPKATSSNESFELTDAVRKVYQADMRVLFTQASQTGE